MSHKSQAVQSTSIRSGKRKRGGRQLGSQNYTAADRNAMLDFIANVKPVGPDGWERVADMYEVYSTKNSRPTRDHHSLKRQWNSMVTHPKQATDPDCPPHIARAKRVNVEICNQPGATLADGTRIIVRTEERESGMEVEDEGMESNRRRADDKIQVNNGDEGDEDEDENRHFEKWDAAAQQLSEPGRLAVPSGPFTLRATSIASTRTQSDFSATATSTKTTRSRLGSSVRSNTGPSACVSQALDKEKSTEDTNDSLNLLRLKLNLETQAVQEQSRGIQSLLQRQISHLQVELGRRDDKIEKLEGKITSLEEKVEKLRDETERLRNEKHLLEIKLLKLEMQNASESGEKRRKTDN